MKNRYMVLFAALLVIGSLLLVACDKDDKPADTKAPTAAQTEPATDPADDTSAPAEDTSAPAEDNTTAPAEDNTTAPAEDNTTAPAEDNTTAPAEDNTTAPAEDNTTAPAEDNTTAPDEEETTEPEIKPDDTVINVSNVTVSSSSDLFKQLYCHATNTTVGAIKDENGDRVIPDDNTLIPLVYRGSVNLGSINLADYSSITITYAHGHLCAQATDLGSQGIYLTSRDVTGANDALTADHGIIAQSTYTENTDSTIWVIKSTTIDLTEVTYEGNVYLTFEFPSSVEGTNVFFGVTGIVLHK